MEKREGNGKFKHKLATNNIVCESEWRKEQQETEKVVVAVLELVMVVEIKGRTGENEE